LVFLLKPECFIVGKFGAKLIDKLVMNVKDIGLSGRSFHVFEVGLNEGLLLEFHQIFTLER
jgi:hypothetical protein